MRGSSLVFSLLVFLLISLATLFSIGRADHFQKQLIFWLVALAIIISSAWIRYENLLRPPYLWLLIGLGLMLLLINLALPNKSWIQFGNFSLQPSELTRLPFLAILALFLGKFGGELRSNAYLALSLAAIMPFVLLILIQPDFGVALLYLATWFIAIINFASARQIVAVILLGTILASFAWVAVLRPYQKERLLNFAIPDRDPLGSGYNLKQVRIALGSAGLFGKGFGQGTQAKLGFLPSAETDFLLVSFLEEWGALGFLIYTLAIVLLLTSLARENDFQANPLIQAFGLVVLIHFALRYVITTAVNLGVAPIIGVPTPFLSYGGSHLITDALLLAVWRSGRA